MAQPTEQDIRRWWEDDPNSNIGIVTGRVSGVAVLDIDGPEGVASLEEIGVSLDDLPESPKVLTGGGGVHLYFRYPERYKTKTSAGILPSVDVRSDGGFVVVPPSRHASGGTYSWEVSLDEVDPADFDFRRVVESKKASKNGIDWKPGWYKDVIAGVDQGNRNDTATKLAGRYVGMGMSDQEVLMMLQAWNAENDPPMSGKELQRTIKSIRDAHNSNQGEPYESEEQRQAIVDSISRIIGMKILDVKRITGDDPKIILHFESGDCTMTTSQLLSPKSFQESIAEATRVVVRKLSSRTSPTHEGLAQMVINSSVDVDAGEEATEEGELSAILREFIQSSRVEVPSSGDAIPPAGCFERDGLIWFSLMDLIHRSNVRWGIRHSMKQMAQKIRAFGAERKVFSCEGSQRTCWGVPPGQLPGLVRPERED